MASITIDEAARYLNVSTRTISTYISQGILSYHRKQGSRNKFIDSTELYEFKEAKHSSEFSIKKFKELQVRVRKLEAQMDVLMRILDTKQVPLGLEPEECIELYTAAENTANAILSLDHIDAWTPILMRLDENDLKNIESALKTDKPWVPFLDICIGMIIFLTSHKQYEISLDLQTKHKELAEARRRIRLAALLFVEARGPKIEIDNLVTKSPDTTIEVIKKILKKQA